MIFYLTDISKKITIIFSSKDLTLLHPWASTKRKHLQLEVKAGFYHGIYRQHRASQPAAATKHRNELLVDAESFAYIFASPNGEHQQDPLAKVKTGDLGEIGDMLSGLLVELKTMDEPEKKGIAGLFRKAKINAEEMKSRFATAEVNVDRISGELEKHKITLLKDVAVMDQMYERNLQYFKELTMYILAGKQKLAEARSTTLHELRAKAEASNLPEDAQAANDFENKCVRFEKKLHDLELTRMISLQTAPQIRMIQNNDTALVEKIQTSVLNTIPLWKNQMVLTLGIENSRRAMEAQRQVTDMTNALLQKNADMLHMASVETAKESERGIVDMETLKHTNEQLISTLDEVLQIQTDGAKKRQEAEAELRRLEGELKQKLLQPRS